MGDPPASLDCNAIPREELGTVLRELRLSVTPEEALHIQNGILGRPPTLAELVLWSIQGSEHCSYKSTRPFLRRFQSEGPGVLLGPSEDAGIVALARDHEGRRYGLAISHESHNHPSQVVPYEGAATGVGGNVRDVCCMGAKVVAVADGLRFGNPANPHTRWIADGVVAGIGGYGNPLGIPNLAGDVYFDDGYRENCLVTVVTLGAIAADGILHSYAPPDADGYALVLVGKPTDNSGFGGASFASGTLEEEDREANKGAVQEPNAFLERHLLKATYDLVARLRAEGTVARFGFKDLGAGGIACASVELADSAGYGAEVELERVPVATAGFPPHVVLCSETQERFLWVVPPEEVEAVLAHYNDTYALPEVSAGARAAVIGRIREGGRYRVTHHGAILVDAPAKAVTEGLVCARPYELPTPSEIPAAPEATLAALGDPTDLLLRLLAHENIASRECVYERYDKNVQGRTVLEAGAADAGVFRPFAEPDWPKEIQEVGAALSVDQNPRYNRLDPRLGAAWAVVEAYRNVVAVGARPVALSDCLCYGNPEIPRQMGQFVAGVEGLAEAAAALPPPDDPDHPLPIVAGNVSLYNESGGRSIPPSPMVACLGRLPAVERAVGLAVPPGPHELFLLGAAPTTLAGSLASELAGLAATASLPTPDYPAIAAECAAVIAAAEAGDLAAAHDLSDGGLAIALAEMAIASGRGLAVESDALARLGNPAPVLFGEFGGLLVAAAPAHASALHATCQRHSVPLHALGSMREDHEFVLGDLLQADLPHLQQTWANGLRERLGMPPVPVPPGSAPAPIPFP
jgi:phosphoribosylformylglycinamidine synthase